MNKIQKLIEKLCPNGVEYKKFDSFLKVAMCKRVLKNQTNNKDGIPFFKIGTIGGKEDSYISSELFLVLKKKYRYPKKGEILLTCSGTIGKLFIFDGKDSYFQDSNIVWIENDEQLIKNKFLYYFMQTKPWESEGSTIQRIYNRNIDNIIVPIPPLEIQNEIVRILDKYTELEKELEKELELRTKQYEYYRDKLFLDLYKKDNIISEPLWKVTNWNKK